MRGPVELARRATASAGTAPTVLAAVGLALAAATAIGLVLGWQRSVVGVLAGAALFLVGGAAAVLAHHLTRDRVSQQERHQLGFDRNRRRLLAAGGATAAAATGIVLAVPAVRRLDRATAYLSDTEWAAGLLLVDATNQPIVASAVREGELVTAYPRDAVGSPDSQAVLIREAPRRFGPAIDDEGATARGFVAYSKLCTHMACPLGLYQQRTGTLLCPCHQALFDVLNGGVVLEGPASRTLPRLPIRITDDDRIEALGDFTGIVGTGFWSRP